MIWRLLTGSPIARALAKVVAVILAVLGYGEYQRRKGIALQKQKSSLEALQAERKAHERINNADTGAGLSDDERIERLRDFAARHGNGSAKTGGL